MEKSFIEKLVGENLSTREIAYKTGISQTTVRYYLRKNNLKTNPKKEKIILTERTCCKCSIRMPIANFYRNSRENYHTSCKTCLNKQTLLRQKKIKEDAVEYKGGKCCKCGYSTCLGALHFHHLNPGEKDINWQQFKNRKFNDAFKKELDKCDLLCANCHAEEHYYILES